MFAPTHASSSSSTLVTTTTDSTSTPSPIHTHATTFASSPKSKSKLSINTSLGLAGSNSPKMSDKGFIEPHASHLPRRIKKRERTKTAPVPSLHRGQEREQQREQLLEQLREQLQLDQQLEPASHTQPNSDPIPTTSPNPTQPVISTHPHRDNLPRRTRVHTVPTNTQTRRVPLPLPISIVDSQSTIGAGTHGHLASLSSPPHEPDPEEAETPNPAPFKFNSKALSLISKAQNKAFNPRPPLYRRLPSSPVPTSPQLPHPAMGLTMGIMEAYATDEEEEQEEAPEIGHPRPAHAALLRFGHSYSPALGVKGTPPTLPSSAFPWPRFVPVSAPLVPTPLPTLIPTISITAPTPPMSAPLGQNLPRRHHRYRRRVPQAEAEAGVGWSGSSVVDREGDKQVLRFERGGARENRVEANEEEDGLFSSLLDFERAGSAGAISPIESCGRQTGRTGEDPRRVQVLGRSRVEVGYMCESEVEERGDCVLVELVESGSDSASEDRKERRLELCLPDNAAVCREGVPSLLPEQIRQGCEFMKGWIGSMEAKRRIRIAVPRWRAQDAFGLAVCFLVWAEAERRRDGQEQVRIVPNVNDLECLPRTKGEMEYTPIHLLYMRLLDDGDGGDVEEERERWGGLNLRVGGKGKGGVVGLGILGVRLGPEEVEAEEDEEAEGDQSAHSDSTVASSRPTSVRPLGRKRKGRRGGYHLREGAIGGAEFERSSSPPPPPPLPSQKSSPFGDGHDEWTGLRDEWRGVLSYEGLNTLVGVWP